MDDILDKAYTTTATIQTILRFALLFMLVFFFFFSLYTMIMEDKATEFCQSIGYDGGNWETSSKLYCFDKVNFEKSFVEISE